MPRLFLENKIDCQHQKGKTDQMVRPEAFIFKNQNRKKRENDKRNNFLNDFELPQSKRSAISNKSYFVGRNHGHVLKKCDHPTEKDDFQKAHIGKPIVFFEFKMTVPGKCHKNIGNNQ